MREAPQGRQSEEQSESEGKLSGFYTNCGRLFVFSLCARSAICTALNSHGLSPIRASLKMSHRLLLNNFLCGRLFTRRLVFISRSISSLKIQVQESSLQWPTSVQHESKACLKKRSKSLP